MSFNSVFISSPSFSDYGYTFYVYTPKSTHYISSSLIVLVQQPFAYYNIFFIGFSFFSIMWSGKVSYFHFYYPSPKHTNYHSTFHRRYTIEWPSKFLVVFLLNATSDSADKTTLNDEYGIRGSYISCDYIE